MEPGLLSFGALLRNLRLSATLSQEELADRASVSSRTVRDLERGTVSAPRASTAAALAEALRLNGTERESFLGVAKAALWATRRLEGERGQSAVVDVPRQLPVGPSHFTGRDRELRMLDQLASADRSGPGIVAVVGMGGVGKTALALHWAHGVVDRFPDGQLYIDLRGFGPGTAMRAVEALGVFLRSLGVPGKHVPTEEEDATAMYRSLVAERNLLIILDNAGSADHVRSLLPGGAGSVVLVTSRRRLAGLVAREGAGLVRVGPLPSGDALTLLSRVLGDGRVAADPDSAMKLAEICGWVPLALRIVAANLLSRNRLSISDQLDILCGASPLSALAIGGDPQTAVRAVLAESYRVLDPPERSLFRLLAVAPAASLSTAVAAVLADVPLAGADQLLQNLADAHLVDEYTTGRYRFHDLVRAYAQERCRAEDGPAEVSAALGRLYGAYLRTVDSAAQLLYPERLRLPVPDSIPPGTLAEFTGREAARGWLAAERPNIVTAIQHAAKHGQQPMAWLLADALRGYFWLGGHRDDWRVTAQVGLDAALAEGSAEGEAACLVSIAQELTHEGRLMDAAKAYAEAATVMRRAQRPTGEITALGQLAMVYLSMGKLKQAGETLLAALDLCWASGSLQGEAFTLHRLASTATVSGNLDDAMAFAVRAKTSFERLRDRHGEVHAMLNIAAIHRDSARLNEALHYSEMALSLAVDLAQPVMESKALMTLASVHHLAGHPDIAASQYRRVLQLSYEAYSLAYEAEALIGLAAAETDLGELDEAERHAVSACAACARRGFALLEGDAHIVLGGIAFTRGDLSTAADHARRAVRMHRRSGHAAGIKRAEVILARIAAVR